MQGEQACPPCPQGAHRLAGETEKNYTAITLQTARGPAEAAEFPGFWLGPAPTRTTVRVAVSKHTEDTDHKVINTGRIKIMDYLNVKGKPLYRYCREISNGCSCPGWGVVRKNLGGWGF